MKITSIHPDLTDAEHKFADQLLYRHMYNNHLFERNYLILKVENIDSILDFVYRRYWEESFLRRNITSFLSTCLSKDKIIMSIAECLQFIDLALPPVFRKKLGEIQSVNDIIDVMTSLLIQPSDQQSLYISILKKVLNLQPFETGTNYTPPTGRLSRLCEMNKDIITQVPIISVDVSSMQLSDILSHSKDEPIISQAQLTFFFKDFHQRKNFDNIVDMVFVESYGAHICNMIDMKDGLCISSYHISIPTYIRDNIKLCYRWIKK